MLHRHFWSFSIVSTGHGIIRVRLSGRHYNDGGRFSLDRVDELARGVGVALRGLARASSLQSIYSPRVARLGYLGEDQGLVYIIKVVSKGQRDRVMTGSKIGRVAFFLYFHGFRFLPAFRSLRGGFLVLSTLFAKGVFGVLRA